MSLLISPKVSLQARFGLAILLLFVCFVAFALFLKLSLVQVRSHVGELVENQMAQVAEVSHVVRELSQILSQLSLVESDMSSHGALHQDVDELLLMLEEQDNAQDASFGALNQDLHERLIVFIDQHKKVDYLRAVIKSEEEVLAISFKALGKKLAEHLRGLDKFAELRPAFERFESRVIECRQGLLDIGSLNLGSPMAHIETENSVSLNAYIKQLTACEGKLREFLFLGDSGKWFGTAPLQSIQRLQVNLRSFQVEILEQRGHLRQLQELARHALEEMEESEDNLYAAAANSRREIEKKMWQSEIVVWVMVLLLVLLLGMILYRLYRRHIRRPMEKVRKRFISFQQGDYETLMMLERSDEWGEIETLFNKMLAELQASWAAVQESERRYRSIFDNISQGLFQTSLEGDVLNANPALHEVFGYELDPPTDAEKFSKLYYADDSEREKLLAQLMKDGHVSQFETRLRRRNGELFWAAISCHLARGKEGEVLFIEGAVEDISRRHQAAEQLKALKEYLHAIVNAMPSILIGVNRDMTVSLWNRRVAELTGIQESEAMGAPLGEVFPLASCGDFLPAIEKTLATGEVTRIQRMKGCSGESGRLFDLVAYPLGGDTDKVVLHVDDVTEKAQIEEVMIQSEKMLSVGSLAAGMAHEINNPLASVLQNVQVMDQRLSPALKKNQDVAKQLGISIEQVADYARLRGFDQMIKSIAESGQRAARIIENMLNFSRKSSSNFVPRSLAELADKTIELAGSDYDMKHHFDFRRIKLTRDYRNVPDVPCEASQVQQVILSLLKNSAQALSAGGEQPEIVVRVFQQNNMACLQVEDNGVGMDDETCRRIFEPFFTTKEVGVGTGLGLSVAYFLVSENHKGRLSVKSEVGKGTCFSVLLPLERSEKGIES